MKIASYVSIIIICAWCLMTLAQLWGEFLPGELYAKITVTMALVGGGIVVASLIFREYVSERQMKKDKFID